MAELLFLISAAGAAGMALVMLLLIARRRIGEVRSRRRAEQERALLRQFMQAIGGGAMEPVARHERVLALAVAMRLTGLLRGAERERLVALTEEQGLLDAPLAQLRSRSAARRVSGIQRIESFPVRRVIATLETLMANDDQVEVRISAASALARRGALPAVGDTLSMLRLRERPVTISDEAVLRVLAERDGASVARAADAAAETGLRAALVEALGSSTDMGVAASFGKWICDPARNVRRAAAKSLGRFAHPERVRWLDLLGMDPDPAVRVEAVRAIKRLALPLARDAVDRLRHDPSALVAAHADRLFHAPRAPAQ